MNEDFWYLLQVFPKKDSAAEQALSSLGIECLAPKFQEKRVNEFTGGATYQPRHLFRGYLFVHTSVERFNELRKPAWIFRSFVSFGAGPAIVDEAIVEAMRGRIEPNGFVKVHGPLKHGEQVEIIGGPLKNFSGIFDSSKSNDERVSLLLIGVGFQHSVEIPRELVRAVA